MAYTSDGIKKNYENQCKKQRTKNLVKLRVDIAKMPKQVDFQRVMGFTKSDLSNLENGDKPLSLFHIHAYKTYFKDNFNLDISTDFLLGYTDIMKNESMDIAKDLGLSDDAIKTLKTIKFRSIKSISDSPSKQLNILNYILKSEKEFEDFLTNLALFMDNNYETSVFWDNEKHRYVDTGYRSADGEIGVTFGYLTKDNKGNDGYKTIGVGIDILESHAMLKMQEIIKTWKNSYKKQKGSD